MRKLFARVPRLGTDGRFRLVRQTSRDGIGTIWAGEDAALGRPVTIRVIAEALRADHRFAELFSSAADQLVHPIVVDGVLRPRISHPNAARVFHVDLGGARSPAFVVMEPLEGESLGEVLRGEGMLEPEVAVHVTTAVARAVHGAHQGGVVHGGVNPVNVLIDSRGTVQVFDFGVAAATIPFLLGIDSELSLYLAPELRAGGTPTFSSDTFAVGAILWAMLTGSAPGESGSEANRPVRNPLANVPRPVAQLCSRALAQNPQARPPSLEDFASALSVALPAGGDTKSRRPGWRSAGGPMRQPSTKQNENEEEKDQASVSTPWGTEIGKFPDPAWVEASLRKLVRDREGRHDETDGPAVAPPASAKRSRSDGEVDSNQRDRPTAAEGPEELRADD